MTLELCPCGHAVSIHRGTSVMGYKCAGHGCPCFIKGVLDTRTWAEIRNITKVNQ